MKRLLGTERNGNRVDRYWQHYGDDGRKKITVETVEDVEPTFKRVKQQAQGRQDKDLKYLGSVPATLIDETCKQSAISWGVKPQEAFAELMQGKTDRAKRVWKMLTQARDYSKLQARSYR